jgi:hypothetical protein
VSNPNITPQLRNYWRVTLVVDYESTFFKMCYVVIKFAKRMLRKTGRPIRIERVIHEFSYVQNPCKEEKVPRQN